MNTIDFLKVLSKKGYSFSIIDEKGTAGYIGNDVNKAIENIDKNDRRIVISKSNEWVCMCFFEWSGSDIIERDHRDSCIAFVTNAKHYNEFNQLFMAATDGRELS